MRKAILHGCFTICSVNKHVLEGPPTFYCALWLCVTVNGKGLLMCKKNPSMYVRLRHLYRFNTWLHLYTYIYKKNTKTENVHLKTYVKKERTRVEFF